MPPRSRFAVVGLYLRGLAPLACALAGCGAPDAGATGSAALRFDPCADVVLVADDELSASAVAGVAAGLDAWNRAAYSHLAVVRRSVAPGGGDVGGAGDGTIARVPIHFQAAGAPFHGLYDPERGQIFINTDLAGHGQSVAVAHEVGHAFGLVHVATGERRSVMNPDNLDEDPDPADVAALAEQWGRRCPETDAPAAAASATP